MIYVSNRRKAFQAGGGGLSYLPETNLVLACDLSYRIVSSYAGQCLNAYNGTGYADIGFTGDVRDDSALATHLGSNDGFARYIYDQSGSATNHNAQQTTTSAMGQIATTGTPFDGAQMNGTSGRYVFANEASLYNYSNGFTIFSVGKMDTTTGTQPIFYGAGSSNRELFVRNISGTVFGEAANTAIANTTADTSTHLYTLICDASQNLEFRIDGTSIGTAGPGSATGTCARAQWGSNETVSWLNGRLFTHAVYDGALSSEDCAAVESYLMGLRSIS